MTPNQQDSYTVASLTSYIRALFDSDLRLRDIWVEGEVSNFRPASSGHWYFTLKDEQSALKSVMWKNNALRQRYTPQNGDRVLAHGYVSVYEVRGEYQLYTDAMQPAGLGDLYAKFEALKNLLEAEGLFDEARKRPLPPFPQTIGVVTSATAAAFQDVLNVLARRYPLAGVLLSPTLVQGETAPPQIVHALQQLNAREDVDVILMVRGGGSLEDLWAFNDEAVVRAVANSRLPVVSGVGHEIDFTLVDFVADVRAPTPSAAAEVATPDMIELAGVLHYNNERLREMMQARLLEWRQQVEEEQRTLNRLSPQRQIDTARQRLDDLLHRAATGLRHRTTLQQMRLDSRRKALNAADPRAILARGFALVEGPDGSRLTHAGQIAPGDALHVRLHQGALTATVNEITSEESEETTDA